MADLLVALYSLADPRPAVERAAAGGVAVRRAHPAERSLVTDWVGTTFSRGWADECAVAFARTPAACFLAERSGALCGFACHGVVCPDFFGPFGVAEAERGRGIGEALLRITLDSLRAAGFAYGIIGWSGATAYFEKTVGARPIEGSEPGPYRGLLQNPR
ncbi:N-acetyltransferase [soil metagenome]